MLSSYSNSYVQLCQKKAVMHSDIVLLRSLFHYYIISTIMLHDVQLCKQMTVMPSDVEWCRMLYPNTELCWMICSYVNRWLLYTVTLDDVQSCQQVTVMYSDVELWRMLSYEGWYSIMTMINRGVELCVMMCSYAHCCWIM